MTESPILVELEGPIATVTLNRPEVRNAFNEAMIAGLKEVFQDLAANKHCRAIVLQGAGKVFCAGADLRWMKKMVDYSFVENVMDAGILADMLKTIRDTPKPVIARVHGAAYGGGVGLIAACDFAFSAEDVLFCLSETRLGILPAVISPFVLEKIQLTYARRYALTAEEFYAPEARRIGLVSDVYPEDRLDEEIQSTLAAILKTAPEAVAHCKSLLLKIAGQSMETDWSAIREETTHRIAERRASAEGQEGMRAFLEKRQPHWITHYGTQHEANP